MKSRGQEVFSVAERIERLSMPEPNSGCWLWLGTARPKEGRIRYGRMISGSRTDGSRKGVAAHRASFEAYCGDIPDGMVVCHRCDNPLCVNPDHLFLGTQKENTDDRDRKGRNVVPRGEHHGNSRITEATALQIQRLRDAGRFQKDIAKEVGASLTIVKEITSGRAWRHLPSPPGGSE